MKTIRVKHKRERVGKKLKETACKRRERDCLHGPHEEAEILRKALRGEKNLVLSKDTCTEYGQR